MAFRAEEHDSLLIASVLALPPLARFGPAPALLTPQPFCAHGSRRLLNLVLARRPRRATPTLAAVTAYR